MLWNYTCYSLYLTDIGRDPADLEQQCRRSDRGCMHDLQLARISMEIASAIGWMSEDMNDG